MMKAKKPDQTQIVCGGSAYTIHHAYPTKVGADGHAKDLRTLRGRQYPNNYTKAIVVDLGKDAGRLRYAVFIAKGRKI